MIARKKKTCKGCGKQKYLFGHGMCKYCYGKKQAAKQTKKKRKPIKHTSSVNTYRDSMGNRYTKQEIDAYVREAKALKKQKFLEKHGYIFCEVCERNDCTPVDMSHLVSVKEAQELGKTELAWDVNNIECHGRKCHMEHEKKSHKERMQKYLENITK